MMYQDIYNCIYQNTKKNEDIPSIMSLKTYSPAVVKKSISKRWTNMQEAWLIHDTKRRKGNQLQSLKLPCRISKLSS